MTPGLERRLLQVAVAVAGIVPVAGGAWGVFGGLDMGAATHDSQARYLSGLLLGIGLVFWWAVPTLERRGAVVRTLAAVVVVGGLARLSGALHTGFGPAVWAPLIMELAVTPALAIWRERIERRMTGA